jgi:hypothetical protein
MPFTCYYCGNTQSPSAWECNKCREKPIAKSSGGKGPFPKTQESTVLGPSTTTAKSPTGATTIVETTVASKNLKDPVTLQVMSGKLTNHAWGGTGGEMAPGEQTARPR